MDWETGQCEASDKRLARGCRFPLGRKPSYGSTMITLRNLVQDYGDIVTCRSYLLQGRYTENRCGALYASGNKPNSVRASNKEDIVLQESKVEHFGISITSGLPKDGNVYGNGALVVAAMRRGAAQGNSVDLTIRETKISPSSIADISNNSLNFNEVKYYGLNKLYGNVGILVTAYEQIKSKPGNMSVGNTPETLDGISMDYLYKLSKQLRNGTFKFGPSRRIQIPKGSGGTRPLSIGSPREKVVQQALNMVRTSIYEKEFSTNSHGFRPSKSCHSARNHIRSKFSGCKWIIESDIRKCFDRIDHDRRMFILQKRIGCQKTLDLLRSALKVGYFENSKFFSSEVGTPQGSIISPILCNIFLNEFDKEVERLILEFNKGLQRRPSSEWRALDRALKKLTPGSPEWKEIRRQRWSIPSKDPMDSNFRRLYYCRYADDFVLGIAGSKHETTEILAHLSNWMQTNLGLEFHPDKTFVRNRSSESFVFLGTKIGPFTRENKPIKLYMIAPGRTSDKTEAKLETLSRKAKITPRISMTADLEKLFSKLKSNGRVRHNGTIYVGKPVGRLVNRDLVDIVRYFNSVFRGLVNYYSFADNLSSRHQIWWARKSSCAFTLSLKRKLGSIHKVFQQFGSEITVSVSGGDKPSSVSFWKPQSFARTGKFQINTLSFEDLMVERNRNWNNKRTKSNLDKSCIICGETKCVQMHHVRLIRGLKARELDFFSFQMAAINRKQVPLCQGHHVKLHLNTRTSVERDLFKQGCIDFVKTNKDPTL